MSSKKHQTFLNLILVIICAIGLGWPMTKTHAIGTIDPVEPKYQLGQSLYLENCATCHIPVPPAVLSTDAWRSLLLAKDHYGQPLPTIIRPTQLIIWEYLQQYSRPKLAEEEIPYRIKESRYFKALHPDLTIPKVLKLDSCVQCHRGAIDFNYRVFR